MINKWYVTGDTHRDFSRFKMYDEEDKQNENLGVIILGDAAINYMLDKWNDPGIKKSLKKRYKFTIYCVKGNHEARPSDVEGMELVWDDNVNGEVWCEPDYPNIKYFKEVGEYIINGYHVLVIGGAYSVDKWYRLQFDKAWFPNEQLTQEEMDSVKTLTVGKTYDFIFSHTCPISWEPTDLFLGMIDQSKVDRTMEIWMDEVKDFVDWKVWLFGHYHQDRLERPYVEMFSVETENLDTIHERWEKYPDIGLDWWLPKSPHFYMT